MRLGARGGFGTRRRLTSGRRATATRAQASAVRASRQHGEQRLRPDAPHAVRSPRTGMSARVSRHRRSDRERPVVDAVCGERSHVEMQHRRQPAPKTCGRADGGVASARRPPRSTSRQPYGRRRCPFDAEQGRRVQSHSRPLGRLDDAPETILDGRASESVLQLSRRASSTGNSSTRTSEPHRELVRIRSCRPWRSPAWCLSGMAGRRRLSRADDARAHRPRLDSPPRQRACGARGESRSPTRGSPTQRTISPSVVTAGEPDQPHAVMRRQDHPPRATLVGGRGSGS
jgi:hypothetical protein